jgi:hypothetical protein
LGGRADRGAPFCERRRFFPADLGIGFTGTVPQGHVSFTLREPACRCRGFRRTFKFTQCANGGQPVIPDYLTFAVGGLAGRRLGGNSGQEVDRGRLLRLAEGGQRLGLQWAGDLGW